MESVAVAEACWYKLFTFDCATSGILFSLWVALSGVLICIGVVLWCIIIYGWVQNRVINEGEATEHELHSYSTFPVAPPPSPSLIRSPHLHLSGLLTTEPAADIPDAALDLPPSYDAVVDVGGLFLPSYDDAGLNRILPGHCEGYESV